MVTGHQKLTTTNWEPSLKLMLLCLEKLLKNSKVDHSMVIWHLKQIGKLKKLNKWAPHELMEKKIIILKCHLLLLYATMNHFLIGLWCVMKSGFYKTMVMTSSVVGLRRSSKALPKAKLAQKKVTVTVRWSASSLIHYSFLNPNEIITSEKVCWANWWDAPKTATSGAGIGQQNGPNSLNFWSIGCEMYGWVLSWKRIESILLISVSCRGCSFQCISSIYWSYLSDVMVLPGFRKLSWGTHLLSFFIFPICFKFWTTI